MSAKAYAGRARTGLSGVGTVAQYTEEVIGPDRNQFLIVRWDSSETNSPQVHESEFEHADN